MRAEVFYWVLNMSIIGSVAGLLVLSLMAAKQYFPLEYKTDLLKNVLNVASLIWIIVSCAIILILVLLYFFTKSELKTAKLISGNIYKSDKITAPAVYGIIQPKIIIPAQIAAGDLDYILLHEQVHIARRDNLFRAIALLTACVHWFNPLSWVFLKYFFADMELACDAKVLCCLANLPCCHHDH